MITDTFHKIVSHYNADSNLANEMWLEIFTNYSTSKRYYHNIAHLDNMMADLKSVRNSITDWETILAVCYHDIVYKVTGSNNEEESCKIDTETERNPFSHRKN